MPALSYAAASDAYGNETRLLPPTVCVPVPSAKVTEPDRSASVGAAPAGTWTVQVVATFCPGRTVRKVAGVVAAAVQPAGRPSAKVTSCRVTAPAGLGSDVVAVKSAPGWAMAGAEMVNGVW